MNGQGCEQLTLFQEDFHASHSPSPGSAEARTMTVTSGRKCSELYANCSPLGSLVKTLLESSIWHSTRYLLTWRASATPAKRLLFRLVASTPRTSETDVQSWATPTTMDHLPQRSGESLIRLATTTLKGCKRPSNLREQVVQETCLRWPTPTTGAGLCGGTGNYGQLMLLKKRGIITEEERQSMSQGNGGQLNPDWVELLMGFPAGWTKL